MGGGFHQDAFGNALRSAGVRQGLILNFVFCDTTTKHGLCSRLVWAVGQAVGQPGELVSRAQPSRAQPSPKLKQTQNLRVFRVIRVYWQ